MQRHTTAKKDIQHGDEFEQNMAITGLTLNMVYIVVLIVSLGVSIALLVHYNQPQTSDKNTKPTQASP
jgi:hypothetical protein